MCSCKRIGNIYGYTGGNFAGNVYDTEREAPSILTMEGGNRQPMVIDPINAEKDGTSRTIKAQYGKNSMQNLCESGAFAATGVVEVPQDTKVVGGLGEKKSNGGTQYYQQDRVYEGDIALAQPSSLPDGSYKYKFGVRVRKLTERECFRLMGVKDEDSDLIGKRQCAGGKYHMAGDSIVTTCLMALFGEALGVDYWQKIDELTKELKEDIWQ